MFAVITTLTTLLITLDAGSQLLVSLTVVCGGLLLVLQARSGERDVRRIRRLIRHLSPRAHHQEYSLDRLESQIEGLLWEVERLSQGVGVQEEKPHKEESEAPRSFQEILVEQMSSVHAMFRSATSVLCYEDEGDLAFVRMGIGGTRFESRLRSLFVSYFRSGIFPCEGLSDGERGSLHTDFSLFGIRYGISYPLSWSEGGQVRRAVLWLGYRAEQPPLEVEVPRCRAVAAELGEYLSSALKVSHLSQKVSRVEETLEQREDYIAHISHDIRTPLNNIQSILRLLVTDEQRDSQREFLETALGNCHSLHDIVDGVVEYSRHKAGKLIARPESFCLNELVEEIVQTFRVTARLRGLDLTYTCEQTLVAQADRRQIRRVITNLVSNAVKYTSYGSITVSCSMSGDENLVVSVADTGVGLTPEQIERLFIPFSRFQEHNTEGAGLGLTLSKILTELNGGTISCASKPGHGSSFSISVPRDTSFVVEEPEQQEVSNVVPLAPVAEEVQSVCRDARILVVDDDADSARSLARTLKAYGFEVSTALTERDALSICNYETPDFVISDFHMPQGGARLLLPKLTELESAPLILVLSGSGDGKIEQEAKDLGAQYVFSKPVDASDLVALFDAILEEREEEKVRVNS